MAGAFKSAKIVFDPLWGLIDIADFLPMLDVPEFQALGFKYQLGVTSLLFPAATHTRKQHSLGSFKRTQELADRWLHYGFINKDEAKLVTAFALWHDIGHGPFSHVVEEVTQELWSRNHDENGAIIIDHLRHAVKETGVDFEEFKKMFTHENPLYLAVHDKNLGTEKLDYLSRDAYYTLGEIPGVEYLAHHTYFIDGKMLIDEKAIDQAKSVQEFYVKMYKTVYLRKNSVIAQRMVQKMMLELLRTEPMTEKAFWALTDFGLLGKFETSPNPAVQEYYRKFMRRELPKTAISVRLEQFAEIEKTKAKAQTSFGVDAATMQRLIDSPHLKKPSSLERIEEEVARIAKVPPRSILIVPPTSMERFLPKDIGIYAPRNGSNVNLSDYYADHFRALQEEGKSYIVLRVCTFEEYRAVLSQSDIAQTILRYLLSLLQ